jgi:hypothetical protein
VGSIRRSVQAQPKIIKKLLEHQINQSERKFSQIKYVSYFKKGKEFTDSTQNPKEIIRTSN